MELLVEASVTVKVTTGGVDIFEQVKVFGETDKLGGLVQLSLEPLSTWLAVKVPFPVPSN